MTEEIPDWLSTTLASDGSEGRGALPHWIRALVPNVTVVGPAFVVQTSQDDNKFFVEAVGAPPPPGCVLVVGGQSTSRAATLGGLYAFELKILGVAGLVTDGLVRDAREIRELPLPTWCRGTTPVAPGKRGPGAVGGSVSLGGVLIRDGDLVIADDDGVLVWPVESVSPYLERARAKYESDEARLARLQARAREAAPRA